MDAEDLPDLTQDPLVQALRARVGRALQGFEDLNRNRGPNDPVYSVPPGADLEARIDAIASLLVHNDLIDFTEFTLETLHRHADTLEGSLKGAREHKRRLTGLIMPGNGNGQH